MEGVRARAGCDSVEAVKRMLHSLACGRHRLLVRAPEGGGIREDTVFSPNPGFHSALLSFRVPAPSLAPSHDARRVEGERVHAIEAAIVRIMKARKALGHGELVGEVLQQLTLFVPSARAVKARIEELVDREYLARDAVDVTRYVYIA